MDGAVVGDEAVAQVLHAHIPRLNGAVDQRGVRARAERIRVHQRGLVHQLAGVLEGADDLLIGVLAKLAMELRNSGGELAFIVEIVAKRNAGSLAHAEVVLTECRRHVDESGAVFGADKAIVENLERVGRTGKRREKRLIGQAAQRLARPLGENFVLVRFFVVGGEARGCQQVHVVVGHIAHRHILDARPGADAQVAVERPGRGGPNERKNRRSLRVQPGGQIAQPHTHRDGGILHVLIVAAGLEVRQRRVELP